eukprot:scaffold272_cov381-Prasinococcus_capsulatus_cf.AAC.1
MAGQVPHFAAVGVDRHGLCRLSLLIVLNQMDLVLIPHGQSGCPEPGGVRVRRHAGDTPSLELQAVGHSPVRGGEAHAALQPAVDPVCARRASAGAASCLGVTTAAADRRHICPLACRSPARVARPTTRAQPHATCLAAARCFRGAAHAGAAPRPAAHRPPPSSSLSLSLSLALFLSRARVPACSLADGAAAWASLAEMPACPVDGRRSTVPDGVHSIENLTLTPSLEVARVDQFGAHDHGRGEDYNSGISIQNVTRSWNFF